MINNLEFRAWDLRSQQMHRVKSIDFQTKSIECHGLKITDCNITLGHNEFKLMQRSPYQDQDNKWIYDGDFVLYLDYKKEWRVNQIYWGGTHHQGWRIKGGKWSQNLTFNHIHNGEIRVIGHIYKDSRLSLLFKYGQDKSLLPVIKHQ